MDELKFNCPACGQHIQADRNYQGVQIQCPACQAPLVVPAPAAEPALRPVAAAVRLPTPTRQVRKASGLALASLVLSLASVVLGPLGFVPGIICGHLARRRLRADPRLGGQGAATAGLLVGYGFLGLSVALLAVVSALVVKTAGRIQQQTKNAVLEATHGGAALPAATMSKSSATPDDAWKPNLTAVSIPDTPLRGRIHGRTFVCDRAELSPRLKPGVLTLRQGEGLQGDIKIMVMVGDAQGLEARALNLLTTAEIPADVDYRVNLLTRENGRYVSKQFSRIQDGFVMRLECQSRVADRIKGRIYLCLGDEQKSYVAGAFEAQLR